MLLVVPLHFKQFKFAEGSLKVFEYNFCPAAGLALHRFPQGQGFPLGKILSFSPLLPHCLQEATDGVRSGMFVRIPPPRSSSTLFPRRNRPASNTPKDPQDATPRSRRHRCTQCPPVHSGPHLLGRILTRRKNFPHSSKPINPTNPYRPSTSRTYGHRRSPILRET